MKKRIPALLALAALLLGLAACGGTKTVHCDHCGAEIQIPTSSNIEEDWIVYCKTCETELFGDNPVVSPN